MNPFFNIQLNQLQNKYQALSLRNPGCFEAEECIEEMSGIISQMDLEKACEEDIQKALDTSRLRRVRRLVTMQNGTVYMKTVYKKLEEAPAEKTAAFRNQLNVEEEIDSFVGQPIHVRWKGNYTGTMYETDKAKISSYTDKTIVVKLTEPFETHNASNYIYPVGSEFIIPRLGNALWNGEQFVKEIVREPVIAPVTVPVANPTRVITSISEGAVGDKIEVTSGDEVRRAEILYIYQPREGVEYQSAAGRTPKFKVRFEDGTVSYVNPASNRNTVKIIGEEVPVLPFEQQVQQMRAAGVSITFPVNLQRIVTGTEQYQERVPVDRFGRENSRGRSWGLVTRTRNTTRPLTPEERINMEATVLEEVKATYGNFNLLQFKDEFSAALSSSHQTFEPNQMFFRFGSNKTLNFEYSGNGMSLTRSFSVSSGDTNVYHSYFRLPSDMQQGDFMKKSFQALYKQYQNIGIRHISVSAALSVGAYAWAKCGFRSDQSTAESFLRKMDSYVGESRNINTLDSSQTYTITREDVAEARNRFNSFYMRNPSNAKFPMRLIASVAGGKAGKALLLGKSWSGSIDLQDPSQRADFETYINNVRTSTD